MTTARTATRVATLIVLPVSAMLALSGCSGGSGKTAAESLPGVVHRSDPPVTAPGPDTALGSVPPSVMPSTIPEPLHVGKIEPIGTDEVVILAGDWGTPEIPMYAVRPSTGEKTARIVAGAGIWSPVIHPIVGKSADDPAVIAAEQWLPRGSRGEGEYTITTYSGNLTKPDEIKMPSYTRVHSRLGSDAVSSDGKYFVFWDDSLYGPRVFDLHKKKETGAKKILGCGPFTWLVGHDIYSVCETSKELIKIPIKKDGAIGKVTKAKVLPDDFVSQREVSFAQDAKTGLLVSANGDVYVFDFSHGLPRTPIKPIGNAGQKSGRFAEYVINNTATSMAITYTNNAYHPDSLKAGDKVKVIISDPATFKPLATLTNTAMGVAKITSLAYSVDGKALYVEGEGPKDGEGKSKLYVLGYDATTGKQISKKEITDFNGTPGTMLTPQVIK